MRRLREHRPRAAGIAENSVNSIEMLWLTEGVLQSRGVGAEVKFPGYIQMEGHEYAYVPGVGHWLHQHKDARSWTRLDVLDESDAEKIAEAIHAHFFSTRRSG